MVIVSEAGRRYDRIQPEDLPEHRTLRSAALPANYVVDLAPWLGPRKDQGNEGSCTGNSFATTGEWIFRKYSGKSPIFSAQYTYVRELINDGNFPRDEGSDGVSGCNVSITHGFCPIELFPYISGQIITPTPEQDAAAAAFRMGAFHSLADSGTAWSVLANATPWLVNMGFEVQASFESGQTAATGIYYPDGEVVGGHEVTIVGCDLAPVPTIRPAGSPPAFKIVNSWGENWGLGGFVWIPREVLDRPTTDLKILHSGKPW